MSNSKVGQTQIILGTAGWQINIEKKDIFPILDIFRQSGGKWIDTSTNYPIDPSQIFGSSLDLLQDWCSKDQGIRLIIKIGAAKNDGSPSSLLSSSYILHTYKRLRDRFGVALGVFSIHFDPRENRKEITETVDAMLKVEDDGCRIGFSGLKAQETYREFLDPDGEYVFQISANPLCQSFERLITDHFPFSKTIGYGVFGSLRSRTMGSGDEVRANLMSLYDSRSQIAEQEFTKHIMTLAANNFGLDGIIVGPRTPEQTRAITSTVEMAGSRFEY